jgi:transketolase
MRTAFIEEITKLATADKNVWLVTGDLGFSMFEDFKSKFPGQFLNVGVAEQNLIGISAGLAMSGKKVFVYSISPFITMRPFEQIRNDLCYQNLPVCLIGAGSAFSYSTFGCTHSALEDLGLMRLLPNMTVMVPGDPLEASALVHAAYKQRGPVYIRIAKKGEPVIHEPDDKIIIGQASKVADGNDASIMVCGRQLPNALAAASILRKTGIKCRVLSFHTVKPLDEATIVKAGKETKGIITVEEHFLNCGFGSAVAEILADRGLNILFARIGIPDEFPEGVGSQEYFLKRYRLTTEGIVRTVKKILRK